MAQDAQDVTPRWKSSKRLQPGRLVFLIDQGEPDMWHEAILLRPATPAARKKYMDETVSAGSGKWWILTPDGDVYDEQNFSLVLLE